MIKNTLALATFVCGVGIWSVQAQTAAPATPMTTPVTPFAVSTWYQWYPSASTGPATTMSQVPAAS